MKIVVLCGGLSAERDVSAASGAMVAAALRRLGHRAVLVDLFFGYPHSYQNPEDIFEAVYSDEIAAVSEQAPDLNAVKASRRQAGDSRMGDNVLEICRAADIVFLALHGEDGEDGRIQAAFDLYGIRYTGTGQLGSAVAMSKELAKQLFAQNGILTPRGVTLKKGETYASDIGFPCVVKPASRGSSVGVSIVESPDGLKQAFEFAYTYDDELIVEQYIKGRECDVGVIGGRALPVIEIRPKSGFYDYKNKYQSGLTDEICPADFPADITAALQRTAARVFSALKLEVYARMDFIVDDSNRVWCLEANTLPGLTPISLLPQEALAAGMSYEDLCQAILEHSFRKYGVLS